METASSIAGRYELGELIGEGGMGTVYKGHDTQTNQPVAIKVLKKEVLEIDPGLVMRFEREGEALRRLDHPNIVKIWDALEENDNSYIIMEYVGGGTLRDRMKQQKKMPVEDVLRIALDLADALAWAHHLRIYHRDIKPGNVLLTEDGAPRLTDFGVAHLDDQPKMTQTGAMVGTFGYLSPETCRGDRADARADIWSFGIMMYEMLMGDNPFDMGQPAVTVHAIMNKPLPQIKLYRKDVPVELDDLIQQMTVKDREKRIGSVRLVGATLEAIIQGADTPLRAAVGDIEVSRFSTPPEPATAPSDIPYDGEISFSKVKRDHLMPFDWDDFEDNIILDVKKNGAKTDINMGVVRVLESRSGDTVVRAGPVHVVSDTKGNTFVDAVFFTVDALDEDTKVEFSFNPRRLLPCVAWFILMCAACSLCTYATFTTIF